MYTLRQSAVMCWGKFRRAFLIALRKKHVEGMLERRRGECLRCGACCKILIRCPSYDDSSGSPRCLIYEDRPGNCGLFPLNEYDLRDRNIIQPHRKCGFHFVDHGNGNGHEEAPRKAPIRWGPPKTHPNGRHKFLRGTWAVLWSCITRTNGNGNGNGNGHS